MLRSTSTKTATCTSGDGSRSARTRGPRTRVPEPAGGGLPAMLPAMGLAQPFVHPCSPSGCRVGAAAAAYTLPCETPGESNNKVYISFLAMFKKPLCTVPSGSVGWRAPPVPPIPIISSIPLKMRIRDPRRGGTGRAGTRQSEGRTLLTEGRCRYGVVLVTTG